MNESYFHSFVKTAITELKHKGKTFAYSYEQRDEILKKVKNSVATYDSKNGCYWITLEKENKKKKGVF